MEATDKENNSTPSHSGTGVQTEEQRARITDNFRSAKSLVPRKRPFQFATPPPPPPPPKCRNAGSTVSKVKKHQDPPLRRLPLSDTRTSCRLPSFDLGLFGCGLSEGSGSSCERSIVDGRIPLSELSTNCSLLNFNAGLSDASANGGGCLVPAVKEFHCFDGIGVDSLKSVSYLDDELDEFILKEIDEICEHTSVEVEDEIAKRTYPQLSIGVEFLGKNLRCDGKGGGLLVESSGEKQTSSDVCTNTVPQAYIDYWQKLNDQQREAACSDIDTPLVIMAGPGSGKTSTMVGRVLMLLKEGIYPRNILAMTFTTAAASEMRDRIGAVVGKSIAKEIPISTFHSFSLQLCRLHAEKLGRTPEFLIYGHGQQRRAIIEAVRVFESQGKGEEILKKHPKSLAVESYKDQSRKWEKVVTQAKAFGKTPDDCRKRGDELGATIFANYNDILRSCNALDYHDFIICSVKLLTDFPEVYKECQSQWKAIVVDEFQDTSLMQYKLLKLLASLNRITVIGDDDQSIFSFNGADVCAFDSFRKDFPLHKEVRLTINYRSTRCIVDAASYLIRNNNKRCQSKDVLTYNSSGNKIIVKECHNEAAQCAFVVDKILEMTSDSSIDNCFGKIAILYRKQATGKAFQVAFRERKIPFNIHGVAFYRKKVIKAILGILRTTLPSSSDASARQAFKALLVGDKEQKKKVIDYVEKISVARKCSFHSAACDIFQAKVSGTFRRTQLLQGRKVLSTLDMLSKLVRRERSITTVVSSAASMIPHKYLLEKRAVVDVDSGKYLNEEHDLRSVLQYLLDDVSEFLSSHFSNTLSENDYSSGDGGCSDILEAFLDYISSREVENCQRWKRENENSVTLTTIHQSKGLEWDTVFIVKVNESEVPLLNESMGIINNGATLEEERRLLYVAITRARKNLYLLYVLVDSNWQFLQPSRFLKEIPKHLTEGKSDMAQVQSDIVSMDLVKKSSGSISHASNFESLTAGIDKHCLVRDCEVPAADCMELSEGFTGNGFLKRFNLEERQIVSHIFHQWAKKPVFQNPKRLLDKVGFVIDERLRNKANKNKDVLRTLKSILGGDEAFQYAEHVLRWQQIPADKRAHLMREKQEHFQKLRIENAMGSSGATAKQISYLQMLGCTVVPASRLHASNLIEQYKSL